MSVDQVGTAQGVRWRVSAAGRIAGVLVLFGWLALALGITVGGNKSPGAGSSPTVLIWIVFVVLAVGVWRFAFVPYVEASRDELVARNAFTKRHIPWNHIEKITPGSIGLVIVTKDGGFPRTAWAVQKSRGARWMNQRGRADEVTDVLMEHVRSANAERHGRNGAPDHRLRANSVSRPSLTHPPRRSSDHALRSIR